MSQDSPGGDEREWSGIRYHQQRLPTATSLTMRLPLLLLCLTGLLINVSHAETALPPPDCSHCKERLLSLAELRKNLPAEWRLDTEREPVFGGEILVVQAGREHAQTLLLVHGLGQNGFTDWLPVMPDLASRYHVITLDLPGFGYSANPGGKYSPANYARVLSWLLSRHAKGEAIVAGHSMGGAVSLRLASDFPQQIGKLILVDAAGILQRTAFVKHSANARMPLEARGGPAILQGAVARLRDLGNSAIERALGLPDPTRMLNSHDTVWTALLGTRTNLNAAMALVEEDFSAAIHTLPHPAWVIWGEEDRIAPLRTGHLLARRLPRAQLLTLPGVGHTPMEVASAPVFLRLLNQALASEPTAALPVIAGQADLVCRGEHGKQYSGRFRRVLIEGCYGVQLRDISAQSMVIRDAIVEMHNIRLQGEGLGLEVVNSELMATGGEISSQIAIRLDNARVDLAGFVLDAQRHAVEVQRSSRLIGSANAIRSPAYRGYWQGVTVIEAGVLAP